MSILRSILLALALISSLSACVPPSNPSALWQIVHTSCEPAALGASVPQKCIQVDTRAGFAILKDINGNTQYLLIPTTRIGGIESPELLAANSPNYWRDAWQARRFVEAKLGHDLPRDAIGLAINSTSGRSQNQLHIHIDCLSPEVIRTLRKYRDSIGTTWNTLPVPLHGHPYRARRIDDPTLGFDPFKLVAPDVKASGESMADQTLLLTGTTAPDGKPAFLLLQDHVRRDAGDFASAEELQDHTCAIGHAGTAAQ
jgi:CDP-diacylglycerol pyrophosphatase